MLKHDDMVTLINDAEKGRDFVSRRDAAILRFHGCTGCRLAEIAGPAAKTVDPKDRVATVMGGQGRDGG
jgi:site-specific recombinase XerC